MQIFSLATEIIGYIDAKEDLHNSLTNKIVPINFSGPTSDQANKENKDLKYNGRTIGRRNDGRWEIKLKLDGGKYKSIYGRTQKETIENYKKAKAELAQEKKLKNKITYEKWAQTWLNEYKQKDKRSAEIMLRMHILAIIGDRDIKELKPIDLVQVINSTGGNTRTAVYVYRTLKETIQTAYNNDIISKDISLALKKPNYEAKNGRALTRDEQEQFMKNLKGDKLEMYYLFVLYSGTRKSEAYNLQWQDIDFDNNTIAIHGTKTKGSDRVIPLFKSIRNMLEPIRKSEGRVFPTRNTTYITKHIKEFGSFRLHDLRHTFTTNAIESGVPMKVVQQWLGHASYNTTANIYTHVRPETGQKYAELLDNMHFDEK